MGTRNFVIVCPAGRLLLNYIANTILQKLPLGHGFEIKINERKKKCSFALCF